MTAFDIASLNGHQDICDELEHHTTQATKTEITEVSGSVGVHVLASAPVGVGYKYVVALLLACTCLPNHYMCTSSITLSLSLGPRKGSKEILSAAVEDL